MVHNFLMKDIENPRLAEDIRFLKDSARFYHDHRDFLFDGRMLKPAKLQCATRKVPFLRASSYTRPHKSGRCVQNALPVIMHSEWRAKDGREVSILVNWTREEQDYEIEFSGKKSKGSIPAMTWRSITL